MPDTGAPANVRTFDGTDTVQLDTLLNLLATSVNQAFAAHAAPAVTDLAALATVSASVAGTMRKVVEGGALFVSNGTKFIQMSTSRFASVTLRNTAYAKASAAYRVQGALSYTEDLGYESEWLEAYNSSTNPMGGFAVATGLPGAEWHARGDSGWGLVGGTGTGATFGSGWTGAAQSGFSAVAFKRVNRQIILNGLPTKGSAWGPDEVMFTLGPGFRPARRIESPARVAGTVTGINIISTGAVSINPANGAAGSVVLQSAPFPTD